MIRVKIYTDGACRGNPGPGGWGAVLHWGQHTKELTGAVQDTTNNRMEMMAAIEALQALKRPCHVSLYTDSSYLKNGITKWLPQWKQRGWLTAAKKPVKNVELWKRLEELSNRHQVNWRWVKGHAGTPGNERADELANQAIDRLLLSTNKVGA